MSDQHNLFWGSFAPQNHEIPTLKLRPDVISMSRGEMFLASCANILRYDYGFVAATDADSPVDAAGNWIPLFTYPCIEYIRQFDLRKMRIFEWGSGASTLYWMDRAESIISIENNSAWFKRMSQLKKQNVQLVFDDTDGFPYQIRKQEGLFDVIVIDSYGYRYDCASEAIGKLAKGGMIILDNSEWHPMSAEVLKNAGFIQIDFSGFKVTESHTSTTSIFLHREFDFPTIESTQPSFGIGSKRLISEWDRAYAKKP